MELIPSYAGYTAAPEWLTTREILMRAARSKSQRVERYRNDIQQRLTKGIDPLLKERLADGFALGTEVFREHIRSVGKDGREIAGTAALRPRISLESIIQIVEELRKEDYATSMSLRGDWGKPLLLWAARRYAGMTLKDVGVAAGGMDYTAVAMAIKRFEQKVEKQSGSAKVDKRSESEM